MLNQAGWQAGHPGGQYLHKEAVAFPFYFEVLLSDSLKEYAGHKQRKSNGESSLWQTPAVVSDLKAPEKEALCNVIQAHILRVAACQEVCTICREGQRCKALPSTKITTRTPV